ncbi:MAG: hypothetical protein HQL51_16725, partial [Magnetococcales bacterium]|nr:hypothetical protein [Magnetococcales bacterium]
MLWKILLPLVVIAMGIAWGMARRSAPAHRPFPAPPRPLAPETRRRVPSWILVVGGALLLGTAWHFVAQWLHDRQLVQVRV